MDSIQVTQSTLPQCYTLIAYVLCCFCCCVSIYTKPKIRNKNRTLPGASVLACYPQARLLALAIQPHWTKMASIYSTLEAEYEPAMQGLTTVQLGLCLTTTWSPWMTYSLTTHWMLPGTSDRAHPHLPCPADTCTQPISVKKEWTLDHVCSLY